jgi:glucosyl-3-phosphoglycerate synthase
MRRDAGRPSISVCVPALDEAPTIGTIAATLCGLRAKGLVDQVVVVDGGSRDGSAQAAREAGAEVHAQADLLPSFGPVLGKGDGVWRAQAVLTGELVCLLDGDLQRFTEDYALRLLAPLLEDPAVQFVKSTFRRPFHGLTDESLGEGGRVTQMAGRPLVGVFYPELAAFAQPLSGQIAIRRELLASLPVSTGYAFDLGLLIDAYRAVGLDAIAQVDIGTVFNRHRDLGDLGTMALEVHQAVFDRLVAEGRMAPPPAGALLSDRVRLRPPYATL